MSWQLGCCNMKNAIERDQSFPTAEAAIFSVTKNKYFKHPSLKPFWDFLLAFNIKSKHHDMAYNVLQDLVSPYLSTSFVD